MSIKTHPVSLPSCSSADDRPVKAAALSVFRVVREIAAHAKDVPQILTVAAADIRSAWEESASPKS